MRKIHVIGIGAGDLDYVTAQAVTALNDTAVFFAMDKGDAKTDLVALRRAALAAPATRRPAAGRQARSAPASPAQPCHCWD